MLDQRIVIAVGFSLFALSCWLMAQITPVWGFWELAPQALRGFSLLLCIVPAVGMALNGVPPEQLRYASACSTDAQHGRRIGIARRRPSSRDHVTINAERFSESMSAANTSHLGPPSRRSRATASMPSTHG